MTTPSNEAATRAKNAATANQPGPSIKAIIHVTLYETHSDSELKFKAEDISFAELSIQFAAVSKHFAQLAEEGKETSDFSPDNKAKEDVVLNLDDLPPASPEVEALFKQEGNLVPKEDEG